MKNNGINDINEFKKKYRKLYEYRIHDLNLNKADRSYQMQEDNNDQIPSNPKPATNQDLSPKPVQNQEVKPQQPLPAQQPIQQSVKQPQNTDNNFGMMSYLKSEMEKLENVVNAINDIGMKVDSINSRLDKITNIVDEIKEPSDIEKLEMRAFDSYPYNKTLTKVWDDKMKSKEEQDMERMGVHKTENGFEMEYIPQKNFSLNQSQNNIN